MIVDFFRAAPGWLIDHPWVVGGSLVLCMALATLSILLNPEGRQLREKLRRKR